MKKILNILLITVLAWAVGFILFTASVLTARPQSPERTTDALVVFTGHMQRIHSGLELFAAGKSRHLFISGVHPDVRKAEILSMWKGDRALPPCCITLGPKATNTIENAEETRDWITDHGYTSVRLVTSDYHMNRALIELRNALPDIEIMAHPARNAGHPVKTLFFWSNVFGEYHKTVFRRIIMLLFPRTPNAADQPEHQHSEEDNEKHSRQHRKQHPQSHKQGRLS